MIRWHSLLYLGEGIKAEYDHVRKLLESGQLAEGIYVVTLSTNPAEQLDIYSAYMFLKNLAIYPEPTVVGIAVGREAAEGLTAQMAFDIYSVTGGVDFRRYFAEYEASENNETCSGEESSENNETFDEQ